MIYAKPEGWREGQFIFNFLEWLAQNKGYETSELRMADSFYIEDMDWDNLMREYLDSLKDPQGE